MRKADTNFSLGKMIKHEKESEKERRKRALLDIRERMMSNN